MGIRILFLIFTVLLVALSVLLYITICELETTQKEVRSLHLRQDEFKISLNNLVTSMSNLFKEKKEFFNGKFSKKIIKFKFS